MSHFLVWSRHLTSKSDHFKFKGLKCSAETYNTKLANPMHLIKSLRHINRSQKKINENEANQILSSNDKFLIFS